MDKSAFVIKTTTEWKTSPRWTGTTRRSSAVVFCRLLASIVVEYWGVKLVASGMWEFIKAEPFAMVLGGMTGNRASQNGLSGVNAAFSSSWQVAADNNNCMRM